MVSAAGNLGGTVEGGVLIGRPANRHSGGDPAGTGVANAQLAVLQSGQVQKKLWCVPCSMARRCQPAGVNRSLACRKHTNLLSSSLWFWPTLLRPKPSSSPQTVTAMQCHLPDAIAVTLLDRCGAWRQLASKLARGTCATCMVTDKGRCQCAHASRRGRPAHVCADLALTASRAAGGWGPGCQSCVASPSHRHG